MFRNLRLFRLDSPWPDSEDALTERLAEAAFEPCGPLTERSNGWVPILPNTSDSLARRLNGADLMQLRSQSRILPAAAINEELEIRLDDYRRRMGEEPPAREKRRMKAETRDELMPKAMLKSDRIWGFVDLKEKLLGVDTLSEPNAERFLRRLKATFGDLLIRPLDYREPVAGFLTKVFLDDAPGQFTLGRECRMQDAKDPGSIVRWTNFDLADKSIRDHVAQGMRLTHLAIVYDNVLSCVIDQDGVISKIKFLGEDDPADEEADPIARFDAGFVLASGTIRNLVGDLKKALGGFH